jgi:hypothetical protein
MFIALIVNHPPSASITVKKSLKVILNGSVTMDHDDLKTVTGKIIIFTACIGRVLVTLSFILF